MSQTLPLHQTAHARRARVAFVLATVALDMLAFGVVMPVMPLLVRSLVRADAGEAAARTGHLVTIFGVASLVAAPLLGILSDRWGRRPVFLVSNFGLAINYGLLAFAPDVTSLYLARVIAGLTSASVPTAYAYVADTTAPEGRARGFAYVGAALGFGFVFGPALGGLIGRGNPRLPFVVAAVASVANGLYGLWVLPESLPPSRRARVPWARANPLEVFGVYRAHPSLPALATVHLMGWVAHVVWTAVFALYAAERYGWDERDVGFMLAGIGVGVVAVKVLLVGPVLTRLGERRTTLVGLAFGTLGFAWAGLAPSGPAFVGALVPTVLWGLSTPPIDAMMSRRVAGDAQGRLQAANGALTHVAALGAPAVFTAVFARSVRTGRDGLFAGAPFLLAALVLLASIALAAWATRPSPTKEP